MSDKQHKRTGIANRVTVICRLLFRKIRGFWSWLLSPSSEGASPQVILRIRPQRLDEPDQQVLSDYIVLLSHLRQRVQVESLTEEIPIDYIGVLEWWNGVRLESRGYLKLQVECVEKKYIAFQRILEQDLPTSQDEIDN